MFYIVKPYLMLSFDNFSSVNYKSYLTVSVRRLRILVLFVLVACVQSDDESQAGGIAYTCTNGISILEPPRVNGQEGCISCNDGYILTVAGQCAVRDLTGSTCASNDDCGMNMGLYCDNTAGDGDSISGQCEPLKGDGDICGNATGSSDVYLSGICQAGFQCNGISGRGAICTTEDLGAPCSHNSIFGPLGISRNDRYHCRIGLFCDLTDIIDGDARSEQCEMANNDHGNIRERATVVPLSGGTLDGYIHSNDEDYFVITVPDKRILSARISINSFAELNGRIQDESFNTLSDINFNVSSPLSLAATTMVNPGTYYIRINAISQSVFFGLYPYSLTVSLDYSNTQSHAAMVDTGSITSGKLSANDIDYFVITVPPGGRILRVYTAGGTDTFGSIEDPSGGELVSDDNSGQDNNFDISYNASVGTYYIKVIGAVGIHGVGAYSLMVSLSPFPLPTDQHSNEQSGATRVTAGSITSGTLSADDTDYFVITVPSGKILRAYITGDSPIFGNIENDLGRELLRFDYSSTSNFDLSYTTVTGTEDDYYIMITTLLIPSTAPPTILNYSLEVSVSNSPVINDNHGNTYSDATRINIDPTAGSMSSTSGNLHIGDRDYFLLDGLPLFEPVCLYTTDANGMEGIATRVGLDNNTVNNRSSGVRFFCQPQFGPLCVAMVTGATSTTVGDYVLNVVTGFCM